MIQFFSCNLGSFYEFLLLSAPLSLYKLLTLFLMCYFPIFHVNNNIFSLMVLLIVFWNNSLYMHLFFFFMKYEISYDSLSNSFLCFSSENSFCLFSYTFHVSISMLTLPTTQEEQGKSLSKMKVGSTVNNERCFCCFASLLMSIRFTWSISTWPLVFVCVIARVCISSCAIILVECGCSCASRLLQGLCLWFANCLKIIS